MAVKTLPIVESVFSRRESTVRSYCRRLNATFDTAHGSFIIDESGRQYVDFLAGCASLNYGHNDPDMKQALLDWLGEKEPGVKFDIEVVKNKTAEGQVTLMIKIRKAAVEEGAG